MEFDFEEALKRNKFTKSDVQKLRVKIEKFSNVPSKISDKKVSEKASS